MGKLAFLAPNNVAIEHCAISSKHLLIYIMNCVRGVKNQDEVFIYALQY
jgi:hypothetical protein